MSNLGLGSVVMTNGVAALLHQGTVNVQDLLSMVQRHASGDWGCVCEEDKEQNDIALAEGDRIMSAYPIDADQPCAGWGENTIWIITEWDRSATTILLPPEY